MELVDNAIKTVCPPAEELSVIVNNVRCEQCNLTFRNEPRLRMHTIKIHERKNLEKIVKENIRYHCPDVSCVYSLKSQRHFTQMKYLKQHYLKVHAAKTFACTILKCDKSFSTEAARQAHIRVCGVQFTCSCCLKIFGTYEALLTHAKRKNHSVDEKYKSILAKMRSKTPPLVQTPIQRGHRPISILPRCFAVLNKVGLDVAVQTDNVKQRNKSPSKLCKRRESRQTQTTALSKEKGLKKTVETQTSHAASSDGKKITRRNGNLRKAKETFTKVDLAFNDNLANEHLFPNSPLQLQHDVALQDCFWEEKNPSLGTQTTPEKDLLEALNDSVTQTELVSFYDGQEHHRRHHQPQCLDLVTKNTESGNRLAYTEDTTLNVESGCYSFVTTNNSSITRADPMLTVQTFPDKFSSIETQTETDYSSSHAAFFDSDVALSRSFVLSSNTETQTTENFPNIEQLLYSNTCTQTCNDILPSDLGLSDIQTQTAWPELEDATLSASVSTGASLLTSTETQTRDTSCRTNPCTNISSCRSWFLNNRISHTETQTDLLSMFDDFQ